ncbi:MAG: Lrp/AsnC ligand binding domain-containing protein [Methanothrix sp.]|nr:Lrp/AsnC family transcriptional regulator [Methanothrix sp.]
MAIGITMLKVLPGMEHRVYHALRCKDGILYICAVFGEYDFMLVLQAEGLNELRGLIGGIDDTKDVIATQMILVNNQNEMLAQAC